MGAFRIVAVLIAASAVATVAGLAWINRPSSLMLLDAVQTKAEIIRRIPIKTPMELAKKIMTDNGYKCGVIRNTSYSDYANASNTQINRGPADILYCVSGQRSGLSFVSKEWKVIFEDNGGKISYVAVGVGLTGP